MRASSSPDPLGPLKIAGVASAILINSIAAEVHALHIVMDPFIACDKAHVTLIACAQAMSESQFDGILTNFVVSLALPFLLLFLTWRLLGILGKTRLAKMMARLYRQFRSRFR